MEGEEKLTDGVMDEVRREGRVNPEMGMVPHRSERESGGMGEARGTGRGERMMGGSGKTDRQ